MYTGRAEKVTHFRRKLSMYFLKAFTSLSTGNWALSGMMAWQLPLASTRSNFKKEEHVCASLPIKGNETMVTMVLITRLGDCFCQNRPSSRLFSLQKVSKNSSGIRRKECAHYLKSSYERKECMYWWKTIIIISFKW